MKIRVLRYFLETARLGSITRAAERLYVTQPTLSRQLKALEDELGKQLFERGSTSIRSYKRVTSDIQEFVKRVVFTTDRCSKER